MDSSSASALSRFCSFLRIPTIANEGTKNGANTRAIEFLQARAKELSPLITTAVHEYAPGRPLLVMTLIGRDPSLPSILLNSHYDVVPVMRERWSVDPFAAEIQADGEIIARGTQDMKCVCMQYLEALNLLLLSHSDKSTSPFLRTVHLSYQPDEETGGEFGMSKWVETDEFRALNIGFALDEGIANPEDAYTIFYGERGVWWLTVRSEGPTGHASRFIQNPAPQKLMKSISHFLEYRTRQEKKLLDGHANHTGECAHARSARLELGDVITLNLTVLKSGVTVDGGATYSMNVIPEVAEASFDIRLPPHVDVDEFETMIKKWTEGEGVTYTVRKFNAEYVTEIDETKNPFVKVFKQALSGAINGGSGETSTVAAAAAAAAATANTASSTAGASSSPPASSTSSPSSSIASSSSGTKILPQVFPAGTDSRFLRRVGIPVLGFSPLRLTPILLHDHNERIHKDRFLEGIRVYQSIVRACADLPKFDLPAASDTSAASAPANIGVYRQKKIPLDA